jgi:hypothetical protein
MTALLDFQRRMAEAVMRPLSMRDNMQRGASEAVAMVRPNSRLSSFERLEIYARSYWSRLLDAFSEDFPGLRAVLGAERFERLRRRYLSECPSERYTMRDLGCKLVDWMERNPALCGERFEIALAMARLEWAEIEAFDAAEWPPIGVEEIASLTAESTLRLQPYLRCFQCNYEVDRLSLELRGTMRGDGKAPRQISAARIAAAKSAAPLYLAVHRSELVVHYKRLDEEMYQLLAALQAERPIGEALEAAYAHSTLAPEEIARHTKQSFALFTALGWLVTEGRCEAPAPASKKGNR